MLITWKRGLLLFCSIADPLTAASDRIDWNLWNYLIGTNIF